MPRHVARIVPYDTKAFFVLSRGGQVDLVLGALDQARAATGRALAAPRGLRAQTQLRNASEAAQEARRLLELMAGRA